MGSQTSEASWLISALCLILGAKTRNSSLGFPDTQRALNVKTVSRSRDSELEETVSGRRFLKDFGHAQNNKLRQFALFRGMELQLWQHNMAFFYDGKGKWEQLL